MLAMKREKDISVSAPAQELLLLPQGRSLTATVDCKTTGRFLVRESSLCLC